MNNDDKILKILETLQATQEQQGKQLEQQGKVLEAIQAVQEEERKDIIILKGATAQSLTIAEAVKAGVESTQEDVKAIKAVQQEHGKRLDELQVNIIDQGAKFEKRQREQDNRLDELEHATGTHNPNKN